MIDSLALRPYAVADPEYGRAFARGRYVRHVPAAEWHGARSADQNTGAAVGDDLVLCGEARAAEREQMSVEKGECTAPKRLSRRIPVRGLYLLIVPIGIFSIE